MGSLLKFEALFTLRVIIIISPSTDLEIGPSTGYLPLQRLLAGCGLGAASVTPQSKFACLACSIWDRRISWQLRAPQTA